MTTAGFGLSELMELVFLLVAAGGLGVAPESGCRGGWGDAGETLPRRVGKALKGLPRYEQAGPE